MAQAFGIKWKDIRRFKDKSVTKIRREFKVIKQEMFEQTRHGKTVFILVFCTGHGLNYNGD